MLVRSRFLALPLMGHGRRQGRGRRRRDDDSRFSDFMMQNGIGCMKCVRRYVSIMLHITPSWTTHTHTRMEIYVQCRACEHRRGANSIPWPGCWTLTDVCQYNKSAVEKVYEENVRATQRSGRISSAQLMMIGDRRWILCDSIMPGGANAMQRWLMVCWTNTPTYTEEQISQRKKDICARESTHEIFSCLQSRCLPLLRMVRWCGGQMVNATNHYRFWVFRLKCKSLWIFNKPS